MEPLKEQKMRIFPHCSGFSRVTKMSEESSQSYIRHKMSVNFFFFLSCGKYLQNLEPPPLRLNIWLQMKNQASRIDAKFYYTHHLYHDEQGKTNQNYA